MSSCKNLKKGLPILTALACLGAQASSAQDDSGPQARYMETVNVNLVNVEVVVTRKGKPVRGLTLDAFRLFDDGKEIEISNFYAVDNGYRIADGTETSLVPEDAASLPERAFIVVLVDNTFLPPSSRRQALIELRRHLDRIRGENNLVMVVSKDYTVKVEQAFTSDTQEIEAALERIETTAGSGGINRATGEMILREIENAARPNPNPNFGSNDPAESESVETMSLLMGHAGEVAMTVRRSTDVLSYFLRSLTGLPGRKVVLYVSDTLPLRPAEMLFHVWFEKYTDYRELVGVFSAEEAIQEFDTTQEVFELLADASTNRVSFYPISANNSSYLGTASARQGSGVLTPIFALQNQSLQSDGLQLLARATGGVSATEVTGFNALFNRLEADLLSYYALGFLSPHGGDGKSHKIEVRIEDPDLKVRYLKSYRDRDPDQHIQDQTLSALFLEAGENPLQAWIEMGEPERQKKGVVVLPIMIKFPLNKLTLVPEDKRHVGSVSICVVVRDEQGRISIPHVFPVPVSIPNDKILNANTRAGAWPTKLAMRTGKQTIGISVRDNLSFISSTLNVDVDLAIEK